VLHVVVQDDGNGRIKIDPAGGLQHLQDRVAAVMGHLHVRGHPATGSTVTAHLPLTPAE